MFIFEFVVVAASFAFGEAGEASRSTTLAQGRDMWHLSERLSAEFIFAGLAK